MQHLPGLSAVASSAGGGGNDVVIWVIAALIIVVAVPLSLWRMRRGGPGPGMNWIPRSMRGKANEQYAKRGWQKPFDDDGERNPDRSSV